VFKNSVEEHHSYPSTECIMIIDGNIARKGRILVSGMEQIRTALFWLITRRVVVNKLPLLDA
jgi:hypothetical protein